MRLRRFLPALTLGATLAGCAELDLTNPNLPSTGTFWQTSDHALSAINATYNGLMHNGTYGRWLVFATDLRSDIGMIQSPWTDLSNFTKFTFVSYDFEVNREIWQHHYQTIFRANQVIDNVPGIDMDAALRGRIVGEAKFIRALMYFNLVNLYENVPLTLTTPAPTDRPATAEPPAIWTQIEKDLTEARAVLPGTYTGNDIGRATVGAAAALLGKAHLQQREWAEAAAAFQAVINSTNPRYDLMENYADNFTALSENNQESVFEVQFGDRSMLSQGVRGLNIARMVGPCGPSYCDGRPTRWYFEEFQTSRTTTGAVDPRLDATMYYNGGTPVYNEAWEERYPVGNEHHNAIFFKKYGEYYLAAHDQDWDAAINFRVIRFADVLLSYAEALNEQGGANTAQAIPHVNRVRARVNLPLLPLTLTQAQLRDAILRERMFEFGLEAQRWNDLKRHNLLASVVKADPGGTGCTTRPTVVGCDSEFSTFVTNKSERLPIPQSEINLNPNVRQNLNW